MGPRFYGLSDSFDRVGCLENWRVTFIYQITWPRLAQVEPKGERPLCLGITPYRQVTFLVLFSHSLFKSPRLTMYRSSLLNIHAFWQSKLVWDEMNSVAGQRPVGIVWNVQDAPWLCRNNPWENGHHQTFK